MTAEPIKPAPPVTSNFMVGSFTDKGKLATDGADIYGRKDKNKTFFVRVDLCGFVWVRGYVRTFFATDTHGRKDKNKAFFVGVSPCESVAISVTYFLQWLVLFRNE